MHSLWDGWTIYIQAQYFERWTKGREEFSIYISVFSSQRTEERKGEKKTFHYGHETKYRCSFLRLRVMPMKTLCAWWIGLNKAGHFSLCMSAFNHFLPLFYISLLLGIHACLDTLESIVLQAKVRFLVRGND